MKTLSEKKLPERLRLHKVRSISITPTKKKQKPSNELALSIKVDRLQIKQLKDEQKIKTLLNENKMLKENFNEMWKNRDELKGQLRA